MISYKLIVVPLLEWYEESKRILPWREDTNPYRVWVSEIMLQQTRVEAVKPYFERFLSKLPTVKDLAEAPEQNLLKLWEGLGYYNRVKNMQKAAKMIMEEYGGRFPDSYELLLKLPGIGAYTAGAVASISFSRPVPAVDGNVLRILTRLMADKSDITSQKVKKEKESFLMEIMPKDRPGDFNQALMELGATVCVPNGAPKCENCPWQEFCEARKQGLISQIPVKTPKKARSIEKKTVLVIRDGDLTVIRKRSEKGLLSGMYEFPMLDGWMEEDEVLAYLKQNGFRVLHIKKLPDAKHIFTHKEWKLRGYAAKVESRGFTDTAKVDGKNLLPENGIWIHPSEIEQKYPIPSAFAAFTGYADIRLFQDNIRDGI